MLSLFCWPIFGEAQEFRHGVDTIQVVYTIDLCELTNEKIESFDFRKRKIIVSRPYDRECLDKIKNWAKGKNLEHAYLTGLDLADSGIEGATNIMDVNFTGVKNLPNNIFLGKSIMGANLTGLDVAGSGIEGATDIRRVNFTGVTGLPKNFFQGKDICHSNLSGLDLADSGIEGATEIFFVNYTGVKNLPKNFFEERDISGAVLTGLDLANSGIEGATDIDRVNFTGVTGLPKNFFQERDISGAVLTELDLANSGIEWATDIWNVNFTGVKNLPKNTFQGKRLWFADLTGLDLAGSGIEGATDITHVNFTGVTNLPSQTFKGKDLSIVNLTGIDLADSGIEGATNISGVKYDSNFIFSRPLFFSENQITTIEREYSWVFFENAKGKYLDFEFNKEHFVDIIKFTNLIGADIQNNELRSRGADIYFKQIKAQSQNDFSAFMKKINKLLKRNEFIKLESFLTQNDLISILKDSPCKGLIDENFQLQSNSPGEKYLRNQFQFKDVNDFLVKLSDVCFQECSSITEARENIIKNRAQLKMPSLRGASFSVNMTEENIHESVDNFLALVQSQQQASLKSTFVLYQDQDGIDAGGLKRDFYDKILEIFKDDNEKSKLTNFTAEIIGRILAMQVGVEDGIPGFNMDLDSENYQKLIDAVNTPNESNELIQKFKEWKCSEDPIDVHKIRHFLTGLTNQKFFVNNRLTSSSELINPKKLDVKTILENFNETFEILAPEIFCERKLQIPSSTPKKKEKGFFSGFFSCFCCGNDTDVAPNINPQKPQKDDSKYQEDQFTRGFFSIISKDKIQKLMPITANELKQIIEGDPTPDGKTFIEKHFNPQGYTPKEITKLKNVLEKYFKKDGAAPEKQKIQVAKLLKFATGSTQIKPDNRVMFHKEGTSLFIAHTCHSTAGCSDEILAKSEDEIVKLLDVSIEYGIASGMQLH